MNFILWTADADIFTIPGLDREIRWYGLLFAASFYLGSLLIGSIFKKEGLKPTIADSLLMYIIVGTVGGARLGHVLFYGPYFGGDGYFSHPLSILKVWEGGLASHGAGFGLLLACFIFARKYKVNFKWLIDRIVIVVALAGCFIRFGNLMNSEIIGKPVQNGSGIVFIKNTERTIINDGSLVSSVKYTDLKKDTIINKVIYPKLRFTITGTTHATPTLLEEQYIYIASRYLFNTNYNKGHRDIKVINNETPHLHFIKADKSIAYFDAYVITRHPSQLYESITTGLLFIILMLLYKKHGKETPYGLLAGVFFTYIFLLRFVYEFLKENQVNMENDMTFNMGQKLSIPMIVFGIYLIYASSKRKNKKST